MARDPLDRDSTETPVAGFPPGAAARVGCCRSGRTIMRSTGPFGNEVGAVREVPAPLPRTLADKLNHLFEDLHPADRGPYSIKEVVVAIRARGGPISRSYNSMLRLGQRDNPTIRHTEALAEFFGVPPTYFFNDAVAVIEGSFQTGGARAGDGRRPLL